MEIERKIEALLFHKGEPMSIGELASALSIAEGEVRAALERLHNHLLNRGLRVVVTEGNVELRTAPEEAAVIERFRKEELARDLGKAGSETLAIILYNGPVTRGEIDFIRGVNSTYILRTLLIRGLIERVPHLSDQRSYVYHPTTELLAHLGISRKEELPDYEHVTQELKEFAEEENSDRAEDTADTETP